MALYGPELMSRIASHSLASGLPTSWSWRDGFLRNPEDADVNRPVAIHDRNDQSSDTTGGHAMVFYEAYGRMQPTFDPDAESDVVDPMEYKFERRDGRVLLRMFTWFTVAELEDFYTNHPSAVFCCHKYYNNMYYHQITLRVAVRREADADLPENWVGAKDPDIRLVYDHTKPSHFRVTGDLLVDVTELLCESSRYPELVGNWKQRFGTLTETDMRLLSNSSPYATITSPNTTRSSGPESVANGNFTWGSHQWNPDPDEEGKAVLNFAYGSPITLGRIKVYGHYATSSGVEMSAPYHWYIEGSDDQQVWQRLEVERFVERCVPGDGDTIKADVFGSYDPVVVDLNAAGSRYRYFRLIFLDIYHTEGQTPSWVSIPIREVELYGLR